MDECFGFLKLIEAETANLPLQGKEETDSPSEISLADTMNVLDAKVNMFINALNDFDAALKAPDSNPATPMTEATDDARDAAWRRTYNFVTAMGGHPDEDIAKAGRTSRRGYREGERGRENAVRQVWRDTAIDANG